MTVKAVFKNNSSQVVKIVKQAKFDYALMVVSSLAVNHVRNDRH